MSSLPCSLQTESDEMSPITTWMRALALGLGALWAAWWTFFALASSVGEVIARGEPFSPVPVVIVLALLGSVVVAWRLPTAGGARAFSVGMARSDD